MKELERLKHNTNLVELDLRLNPVTKEENDYRLFLIKILGNLKVLDDRAIRDSEREMAHTFLQSPKQHNGIVVRTSNENGSSGTVFENGAGPNMERDAILARVKSVSNIAKRSAGQRLFPIKQTLNATTFMLI